MRQGREEARFGSLGDNGGDSDSVVELLDAEDLLIQQEMRESDEQRGGAIQVMMIR